MRYIEVADLDCTIVVPRATPKVKCDAIRGYGADLQFCENSPTSRYSCSEKYLSPMCVKKPCKIKFRISMFLPSL